MIRTDRKFNQWAANKRIERIDRYEKEHDKLVNAMFEQPEACTKENISRLNYLASQIEIMKGNKIYHY